MPMVWELHIPRLIHPFLSGRTRGNPNYNRKIYGEHGGKRTAATCTSQISNDDKQTHWHSPLWQENTCPKTWQGSGSLTWHWLCGKAGVWHCWCLVHSDWAVSTRWVLFSAYDISLAQTHIVSPLSFRHVFQIVCSFQSTDWALVPWSPSISIVEMGVPMWHSVFERVLTSTVNWHLTYTSEYW